MTSNIRIYRSASQLHESITLRPPPWSTPRTQTHSLLTDHTLPQQSWWWQVWGGGVFYQISDEVLLKWSETKLELCILLQTISVPHQTTKGINEMSID